MLASIDNINFLTELDDEDKRHLWDRKAILGEQALSSYKHKRLRSNHNIRLVCSNQVIETGNTCYARQEYVIEVMQYANLSQPK